MKRARQLEFELVDPGYIYALVDPRDGQIRYIGQAVKVERRYRQHVFGGRKSQALSRWIQDLQEQGLLPTQRILTRCAIDDLTQEENKFITKYKDQVLNHRPASAPCYGNKTSYYIECVETGERFESYTIIARRFGVSPSTVSNRCDDGRELRDKHFRRLER